MKKTKMLKKNYEFRKVLSKGKNYYGDYIQAVIIKSQDSNILLGLAINTKSGKAVERNRIKRLLRENYQLIEPKIKDGYEIVFLVKKKVNLRDISFYDIKRDMKNIFIKAKIII